MIRRAVPLRYSYRLARDLQAKPAWLEE